jgi:hypothetical protein
LVRESYEELLWWLLMPSLLRMGSESAPSRIEMDDMRKTVEEALAAAESVGYRVDRLIAPEPDAAGPEAAESEAAETEAGLRMGGADPVLGESGQVQIEPVEVKGVLTVEPEDAEPHAEKSLSGEARKPKG